MEQFITGDIWTEVNKKLTGKQKKTACIAYVTSDNLKLTKGDILVCDASNYSIKNGNTSADIIENYFTKGIKIYSNQDLHSKLLLTDQFLVIGSSNLSTNSATNLIESAVLTDNDIIISQSKAFCYNLIQESTELTRQIIDDLKQIEVIKRTFKPTSKSKIRTKVFGKSCWIMPTNDLSDKVYETVKERVEESKKKIAEKENLEEGEIGYLRNRGVSKFTTNVKIGDQIILNWCNKGKSRRSVFPPATILRIEKDEKLTHVYYDDSQSEKQVSWTKFKTFTKNLELELKTDKPRTKILSDTDLKKMKPIWK